MNSPTEPRKRLAYGQPHPYFVLPNQEDEAGGARAFHALIEFQNTFPVILQAATTNDDQMQSRLVFIAGRYNYEKSVRTGMTYKQLRLERWKVIQAAARLERAIADLGDLSKDALYHHMSNRHAEKRGQPMKPSLAEILQTLAELPMPVKHRSRRGPRVHHDIQNLCGDLAEIWFELSGKRVPRSGDAARGKSDIEEFIVPGMLFIQRIAQAIDPNLTITQLRTFVVR